MHCFQLQPTLRTEYYNAGESDDSTELSEESVSSWVDSSDEEDFLSEVQVVRDSAEPSAFSYVDPGRNWKPNDATVQFNSTTPNFQKLGEEMNVILRSDDAARFVGEQPLIFPAYGKPMPYMVHVPSGEKSISAVLLLKEPTVPKSGPDSFRETGLAGIMEKTVDSTGEYNYVNASIRMLCKEMPEHEGLSKTAIEDSCVVLDRFPFSLPYGFQLEDFLKFLEEHHTRVFDDYMRLTNDCFQSVLNLVEARNIGSQPLPLPKLYTFGAMARKSTETTSFLYMPSSAAFEKVCIWHPSVFVDLRHSPTNPVHFDNIQAGLNDLLTEVAGRPIVGSFCSDFQSKNSLLIENLRGFRSEIARAGGSATVATHGPQLANGGRASRIEVGTPNMNNDMTTDQSHKLHTLCHVKHKESTLGFCWSCSKQLPYGYFAMVNNKLCATIRCTCGKSFSTQSTRL